MIIATVLLATAPSVAATSAYGTGQSYVRLFQDVVQPGTCGIVLERQRCSADLHAVQQWRGSDSTDATFSKWLADGDVALHTNDWNGSYVTDKGWADNPVFAWWYTAGVVSIAIQQPRNDASTTYLGHFVDELERHPLATPDGFQNLIVASGTPFERAKPLQRALDAAIPPQAYPSPAFAPGLTGTAQLGVYLGTLLELVDSPLALSRPESRGFAAIVLTELQKRHQDFADRLSVAELQSIVYSEIPDDPAQLDELWRKPLSDQIVNTTWPEEQRYALVIGELLAQTAYNAAILKDAKVDRTFRSVVSQLSKASLPAGVVADISALHSIPLAADGGSWIAINRAATKATLDLIAAH